MQDTSSSTGPRLRRSSPPVTGRQWMIAGGFLVVLIVAIALAVALSGKSGPTIHPTPAPAATPTATADVTSRAP
ncbi:MAG TPA: hypothetical protein VHE83_16280 [Mycobacteriales bacterium]|nr:hypothetical protein [Mycobacteriales bacterium]